MIYGLLVIALACSIACICAMTWVVFQKPDQPERLWNMERLENTDAEEWRWN